MFSISQNGIIQISKGDTCYGNLFINIGTELDPIPYVLGEKDALYFGVTEANGSFRDALICKKLTKEDKTPGIPPVVGDPLRTGDYPGVGKAYYTREETDKPVGYLVAVDPEDGLTYEYSSVTLDPTEPISVEDDGKFYHLFSEGYDYIGYYVIHFDTEDTENVAPGVYYYEIKLLRIDEYVVDAAPRVDAIVPKTKFIVLG